MAEYCGIYHQNPYHLLGLHDIFEAHSKESVEQVVAQLMKFVKLADNSTPEGKYLAKLYTDFARDFPKVVAFEDRKDFRQRESTTLKRYRLERPDFKEHLERVLHQYFSEQALPFYANISDKVKSNPILYSVEFIGAWPSAREGENISSLSENDPRFKERPAAEALEIYPDDKEFLIAYTLVFDRDGFQAWTDSFHQKEWRGMHSTFLAKAHRLL